MEKLMILDGNSLMNRAFYAVPTLTIADGTHTNGIYGFLNMLDKVKEDIKPDYIVATFDRKAPTFRHIEYKEYKAGRKKMPEELAMQFPILKDILRMMAINIFEIDGFEADDLIGTLSNYAESNGLEVYIVTGDRDALQLATDNIKVVLTKNKGEKEIYDANKMMETYGVTPTEFIDVKGLMGDSSDNIPGVPGIGEKTAYKLIKEYKSIENLLCNLDKLKGKMKENLENNVEQAIFSKKLATIETNVPVEIDLEEIKSKDEYDVSGLRKEFTRLQFKSLLSKLPKEEKEDRNIEVLSVTKVEDISINEDDELYITYGVKDSDKISTIELSNLEIFIDGKVYNFNLDLIDIEGLKDIFQGENNKIIHSSKNLYTILRKHNIDLNNVIFDTEIAAYIIDSSRGNYNIKDIVFNILGEDIEENIGCSYLKDLYFKLKEEIEKLDMQKLYYDVELPLVEVLSSMEQAGFKVDEDKLDELGKEFKDMIITLEKDIYNLSEEEFNINSPKQLGKILFEKLDLPVIKKTKTGYSTNADVLEKLKDKHPIVEKIIEYRHVAKLYSTYIEGLKNVIDEDGRIHSSFNQTVTTTGRLSSTEPNLQNIPIRTEMGRSIRKVFVPFDNDSVILSADYSQIELRVLAHMSEDENMINAFNSHLDIHTKTASEVFGVKEDEVSSEMRSAAKAVNFGIIYGMSDFALGEDLKISKKEAKKYIDIYFERYPKISEYLSKLKEDGKKYSYVKTILNRRRFIPEISSSNKIVKALGERLAMNAPIQGSAADIIKLAMVNVWRRLRKEKLESSIILQVHDEIIINAKKEELEKVKVLLKEEMENVIEFSVKLEVDENVGETWYEAK